MSWRRWKLGLCIAIVTGVFSGGVVAFVDNDIAWKKLVFIMLYFTCQNGLLFLKDHPVDTITDATEFIKKTSMLFLCAGIWSYTMGCASYVSNQTDSDYDTNGVIKGTRTTKVLTRTFFNAKSDVSKSSVTQGDKTQSARVGSVSQSATNNLEQIVRIVIEKAP